MVQVTTYPPLGNEEIARAFAKGQRTFFTGLFIKVEFMDDGDDVPIIVEAPR
jgi:hypothetical protein